MRGADVMQEGLFSFKRLEEFVPPDHPLRSILNAALVRLYAEFNSMYAPTGRDSIVDGRDELGTHGEIDGIEIVVSRYGIGTSAIQEITKNAEKPS